MWPILLAVGAAVAAFKGYEYYQKEKNYKGGGEVPYTPPQPVTQTPKAKQNYKVDIGPSVAVAAPQDSPATLSATDIATAAALGAMGVVNTKTDPLALRKSAAGAADVLRWMAPGSPITILAESADGYWCNVISGGVIGWASKQYIKTL